MALMHFGYVHVQPNRETIAVPLGLICLHCGEHFKPDDKGIVMPWDTEDGLASCAYHLRCLLNGIIGDPSLF